MSSVMISTADVPTISGSPSRLGDAAELIETAATSTTTTSDAVVTAWKGVNEANYDTPEALGVRQSIPRITDPMTSIGDNLASIGSAIATASTTLTTLRTRRTNLVEDIRDFRTRALAADAAGGDEPMVCTPDNPWGLTGWQADAALVTENNGLWTRAGQLQTDLDQTETDLVDDLAGIFSPNPWLPAPSWEPGEPAGTYSVAGWDGPGASADAWSGTAFRDGNWYAGAGAEAEAHLFDANAEAHYDGPWGQANADASVNVGALADASANGSVGVDGVHGQAQASASAGVTGEANADYTAGPLSTAVGVKGLAGARANANGGVDVGLDGVSANAGVEGFAGARAEANGSVELAGVKGGAGADVRAGIGGEANADIAVTTDEVRVTLDVGLAVGVGAGVEIDVSFSPKELVEDVKDLWPF